MSEFIQPAEVIRDQYGYFYHPELPAWDEAEQEECAQWHIDQLLESIFTMMENDIDQDLYDMYLEDEYSVLSWVPSQPDGEGWFCLAISDCDDGPFCHWVRRVINSTTN